MLSVDAARRMIPRDTKGRNIAGCISLAASSAVSLMVKAEPNWLTYSKLQELAERVELELQNRGLKPHSRIDVQEFIWTSSKLRKASTVRASSCHPTFLFLPALSASLTKSGNFGTSRSQPEPINYNLLPRGNS